MSRDVWPAPDDRIPSGTLGAEPPALVVHRFPVPVAASPAAWLGSNGVKRDASVSYFLHRGRVRVTRSEARALDVWNGKARSSG